MHEGEPTDHVPGSGPDRAQPSCPAMRRVFCARLTPYRSLLAGQFRVLICGLAAFFALFGGIFAALGAWPVSVAMAGIVFLIWLAFQINYRAARAWEEIRVSPLRIDILKVSAGGQAVRYHLNPFRARLRLDYDNFSCVTNIMLHTREESVVLGTFLNGEDKTSFARALGRALASARGGGVSGLPLPV